ncbi:nuclear factor related to kappa-B-binding protein [Vigna unguiculata]|uniref:Nuclear factor related to kappa-B-binding protein n=1 Tax=Vigna unguiculata TaxID=3917 RepID=A0A4D6LZG8_VIGUN|nr:nuclear factor related to kappa-B-binding protein [Vigna unguiculata]
MAADQRRKRVNGANIAGYGSREQQRIKRKNLGLVQNDLNMRSHISVEWDGNQKKVVAKREQVGISWRQTKPFINSVANGHKLVADVLTVPQEIFDLDNLSDVLSYEVWMNLLSENERNLLMNFLPRGFEPHQVVEDLLTGINFNFGNPFTKWQDLFLFFFFKYFMGASLCLGDLHPDMIVYREQHLKSEKREYYSHIHNYHNDMIGFLSNLKKSWQSCKDLEKEIVQKTWRSKRVEKRIPSKVIESRVYDHDGNVTGTSESCSWDAEDKACSSDNQISSLRKDDKLQRRVLEKDIVKGKSRNLMDTLDKVPVGEKPKTGDKLPKRNSHSSDGDKYMSYIKISRQQHELVKNMKQSGKSIQSRSLNRVLGNLEKIDVQPYNIFVKEEKKKLQEHWLLLVNKDLPQAYVNWKERQRQRDAVINSLVAEMKDRSNSFIEEEDDVNSGSELKDQDDVNSGSELHDQVTGNINSGSELHDQDEDMNSGSELQDQDGDNMNSGSELQDEDEDSISSGGKPKKDQNDDNVNAGGELQDQNEDNVSSGSELQDQGEDNVNSGDDELQGQVKDGDQSELKDDEDFISRSPEHQSLHNSYVGGDEEFNPMSVDTEKNLLLSKSNNTSPNKDGYSRNMNSRDVSVDEGTPFTSSGDVWQGVEMPHSYYDSAVTHEYTASGLSLANPQASGDQPTRIIDLEADLRQETRKELLGRQLDDGTFSSYQIQDRSVLLPSLFKGEGLLPYHREQKGADLDFQTSNNVMMGDGQFSSHFKEPLQTSLTLDQGRRRATEVFMPENMSHNIYSDGGRYSIPRQDPIIPRQEQLVPRQDPIIPRQEHLIPRQDPLGAVNMTDWASNNARIAGPSQSHLNTGDFIGHHWFPADHQIRGGWNGSDSGSLSSQSLGTGASSDQSLFSILSECNQLRSGSPYDSVRNTDQFVAQRTYGLVDAGTPRVNTIGPPASHPLDYFTGREAASGLVPDDITWMSLPHQNSSLHDQMGKPYLRSWNR